MNQLSRQSGFTLIEIMVVVVILGILAAFVVPKVMSRPDQARVVAATSDVKSIETAVNLYRLDHGKYPPSLEALTQPGRNNPGGYLDRVPKDPWDNEYIYRREGRRVVIASLGADGAPGGEGFDADIDSNNVD